MRERTRTPAGAPRRRQRAAGLGPGGLLVAACLALGLGGCCTLSPWRCGEPGALRIPVPEPYLLVRADVDGAAADIQIVYLPHPAREMLVRPGPFARDDYDVELAEGGFLARVSGRAEVRQRPRVSLPGKPSGAPQPREPLDSGSLRSGSLRSGSLRPGLYKLVWKNDPLPDLIPVAYFEPEESPPARAVVDYRAVSGQPEIIEEILIHLDGGDAAAIARQVRVYRGEDEVTAECIFEPRGNAIAIRLPAAYRGSFAPYRIEIEPLSFAAAVPPDDALAELKPRAEIRAVEGGRGPRFAIEYDRGRGSPISLERTLETVRLGDRGPEAGLFRMSAPAPSRHLLEITGDVSGPMTLAVTPVNMTGLKGETAILRWERPPPAPPSEPTVVEASLSGPFDDQLVFGLEIDDPERRVDLDRTGRENRDRSPWSSVDCSRQNRLVRCGGRFSVRGEPPDFAVYCLGRPRTACLTAEVMVRR